MNFRDGIGGLIAVCLVIFFAYSVKSTGQHMPSGYVWMFLFFFAFFPWSGGSLFTIVERLASRDKNDPPPRA